MRRLPAPGGATAWYARDTRLAHDNTREKSVVRHGSSRLATGLTGEILLGQAGLELTDSVTITGPGADALTVRGDGSGGAVIRITSAIDVVISHLTISGGTGTTSNSGGVYVNAMAESQRHQIPLSSGSRSPATRRCLGAAASSSTAPAS